MCIDNKYMSDQVPFSIYSYYCWQLLLARLNELNKLQRKPFDREFYDLVFAGSGFTVHELIHRYLSSLGEFVNQDNELMQLAPITGAIDDQGEFGIYSEVSAQAYEQVAAPNILIHAMRADLVVPHVPDWPVPNTIQPATPAGQDPPEPNPNLLGWTRSIQANRRSQPTYARLGITAAAGPPDVETQWKFSPGLMQYVSTYITEQCKCKLNTFTTGSVTGSPVQAGYLNAGDPENDGLNQRYVGRNAFLRSNSKLSSRISAVSFALGFRLREEVRANGAMPFLGFTFDPTGVVNIGQPPPPYVVRPNWIFNSVNNDRINALHYRTNIRHRKIYTNDVSRSFMVNPG
jgi:hypothetical protein